MAVNYLTIVPDKHQNSERSKFKAISFGIAARPPKPNALIGQILRSPLDETAKLVSLPDVYEKTARSLLEAAYQQNISGADALDEAVQLWRKTRQLLQKVPSVPSITDRIHNLDVTSLMDGEQIFNKTLEHVRSAKKSILIKMFEFQNLKVDGKIWRPKGAENVGGFGAHQLLLQTLVEKKRTEPDLKIQVILDAHKWYIDSSGRRRHYNNKDMIKYLKENGIDVIPAPRQDQGGAVLNHDKFIVIDNKKAIIGGMNWGTHSCANHDFCIALERVGDAKSSEIDNLTDLFNKHWKFSWYKMSTTRLVPGPLNAFEQKFYRGIDKEIKAENVEYNETIKELFDNPETKKRYYRETISEFFQASEARKKDYLGQMRRFLKSGDSRHFESLFKIPDNKKKKYYEAAHRFLKLHAIKDGRYGEMLSKLVGSPEHKNKYFYEALLEFIKAPTSRKTENYGLNITKCTTVNNSDIKVFSTLPRAMEEIGGEGSEGLYKYLINKVNTCKNIYGELFYFTQDEIIDTIIKRAENEGLKAQFIIHEADFPFCKEAYYKLKGHRNIDIGIYKENKAIDQRFHIKTLVFDNEEILVGSANISDRALLQDLGVGSRKDLPMTTAKCEKIIKEFSEPVKIEENKLGLPNLEWNGSDESYKKLKERMLKLSNADSKLVQDGEVTFELEGKIYYIKESLKTPIIAVGVKGDDKKTMKRRHFIVVDDAGPHAVLRKIYKYYVNIAILHNKKPKHQRGNSESGVVLRSKKIAKRLLTQFSLDKANTYTAYEDLHKSGPVPYIPPRKLDVRG